MIPTSSKAKNKYEIGFADKTNFTLVYEYTLVDADKLDYLYLQTGVQIYEDLAKIDEGDKYKMTITNIEDNNDYWEITSAFYSGKSLDERKEDSEYKIYKKPEDLVDELFEVDESEFSLFNFIPVKVEDYLEDFNQLIINDNRYNEEDYSIGLDENGIAFDYTYKGYSDTIIQEYNEDGILESSIILCDEKEAFKKELINSYEDLGELLFLSIIIIVSLCCTYIIIHLTYYRKSKVGFNESKNKIDKLIKKIK